MAHTKKEMGPVLGRASCQLEQIYLSANVMLIFSVEAAYSSLKSRAETSPSPHHMIRAYIIPRLTANRMSARLIPESRLFHPSDGEFIYGFPT